MMSLQRNYYEVLGIPTGATTDQIKKKYRELARKFHPDVVQDKALGQRVFTQINQAYSVLGDPERRAQYNVTLSPPSAAAPKPAPTAPASPAPASAPPPPSAQKPQANVEILGKAENAIMAGKPIEARAFCMRVLETDPRHVRALEILGDALIQMGRREEAAVQYRRALQISPSMLIQAKLNQATQSAPSTKTLPPQSTQNGNGAVRNGSNAPNNGNGAAKNGNGSQRTILPAGNDTEKSGGLLGRLLGRK
jgi:curved DNA-binding protein CbpA